MAEELSKGEAGAQYYDAQSDAAKERKGFAATVNNLAIRVFPVLVSLMLGSYGAYMIYDTGPELVSGLILASALMILVINWARESYVRNYREEVENEGHMLRRVVEGDRPLPQ